MSRAVLALAAVVLLSAVLAPAPASAAAMPCVSLPASGPPNPVFACLNGIAFNATVALNVLQTNIRALEGAYAFRDISVNYADRAGVYPTIQLDIVSQLQTINAQVQAYVANPQLPAPFASDYAFQFAVQDLFSRLYDAHTSYALPAPYSYFVFYQLMRFEETTDNTPGAAATRSIKVYPIAGSNAALYALYNTVFGGVPFQVPGYSTNGPAIDGWTLQAIDGVDAYSWFAREADRVARISRDPGTRWNLAVHGRGTDPYAPSSWAGRSLSTVMPTHDNHTYTLVDSAGVTHQITLHWLAINRAASTSVAAHDNLADAYAAADPDDDPAPVRANGKGLRPPQLELPFETEHRRMARGTKRVVTQHLLETTGQAADAVGATTPPQLTYRDIGNGIGVIKILSFPDMTSSDGAVLLNNLQLGIAQWVAAGNTKLFLDLNGNGGGDICGGYAIIRYLFPQLFERDVPLVGQYDWPVTPLFSLLANASFAALETAPGTGGQQLYPYVPWYWKDPVRARGEHFGHRDNRTQPDVSYSAKVDRDVWLDNMWVSNAVTRTRVSGAYAAAFTQLVGDTCDSTINLFAATPDMFPAGGRLDPTNVVLMSNGFCGSTCSVFSSFIQMHNLAKTVVFGGLASQPQQQFWSFPGGQVGDMTAIWPLTDYFGLSSNPLVPPKPLPGAGSARMTFREIYPWNWAPRTREDVITTAPLPLEWHFIPATFHAPYFSTSRPSDLMAQYEFVRTNYLTACVDGLSVRPACVVAHGSGVQSCSDASNCRVTACDAGFYAPTDAPYACSPCPKGTYRNNFDALFTPLTQCVTCTNAMAWAGPDSSLAGHSVYTAEAWTSPECPYDADNAKLSASLAIVGVVMALVGGLLVGGGVVWYARRRGSQSSLGVYTDKRPLPSSVTGTPQL